MAGVWVERENGTNGVHGGTYEGNVDGLLESGRSAWPLVRLVLIDELLLLALDDLLLLGLP
jgi:hypothetical protein